MQFQKPVMRQEQRLKMSPQLYQAIKLLTLPLVDLRLKIQEEIEKNPALEIVEDHSTVSSDEDSFTKQKDDYSKADDYNIFEETSDSGYSKYQGDEEDDSNRKFIEGAIARPESLQDHLLWQLRLQPIPSSLFRIGEILISNLDGNGFHIQPPENCIKLQELPFLEKVIPLIQKLDPVGCCTKDFKESLVVQIHNHPHPVPLAEDVVERYFDLLEKGKYKEIANKLKIKENNIQEIVEFLNELNPLPGKNYATVPPDYVVPDIMVKLKDGDFVIILNDEEIPVLGINPFFTDIAVDKKHKDEKNLNEFVSSSIKNARWFIKSIKRRNETLLKVCKAIIEFQRDFFRKGPKYLVPLTLKDIAEQVNVHEGTVSRITNGKYIQTEWGIFELKYFFSNSISGSGSRGSRISKQSVKEQIREIVETEGKASHLSDKRIAELLLEKGIKIERRTVTKYRNELNIMSSYQRR
jgi:RNA polymerase sigma-54 factor